MNPLVVTLAVDDAAQRRWDDERRRLFPAGRTMVGAHVTLFHAVPGELQSQVRADLEDVAGPCFDLAVTGVQLLGRGVAYRLGSDELARRHRRLQQAWWPHLTRQDQQGLRPHVTVQNKVTPEHARRTAAALQSAFAPTEITALGWRLWRYEPDGTWTALAHVPFPA